MTAAAEAALRGAHGAPYAEADGARAQADDARAA
jgi:hypothetical protein